MNNKIIILLLMVCFQAIFQFLYFSPLYVEPENSIKTINLEGEILDDR